MKNFIQRLLAAWLVLTAWFVAPVMAEPIPVADVQHNGPVDFEKEILPIFRRSCLACHNQADKEGKFVIETPASILKGGGEGPAVVPGKSAESLLLKLASHRDEPIMPPDDNKAKAKPLTSQELGLVKLWIDQGAQGTVKGSSGPLAWQPLPPGLNPIYSVAVSPEGQYAAASRANQVFLYNVPAKREIGRLTDPGLIAQGIYKQPGVADLDIVQSMRFSPNGQLLATGGFRTAKLWRRPEPQKQGEFTGLESAARSIATSPDGKLIAVGEESGKIRLFATTGGNITQTFAGHTAAVTTIVYSADGSRLLSGSADKTARLWDVAAAKEIGFLETPATVNGVAFQAEEKQIATAHADNKLRTWPLPAAKTEGGSPAMPLKEMSHGGPVVSIQAVAGGTQIVAGCSDGQVRLWDANSGNALKAMNYAAPVLSALATADGKRFLATGANNAAKLFNGENGQPLADIKGDYRTAQSASLVAVRTSLAKRNVESAKNDLTEANKRKTSEEENLKKSKEEVTKTEAELKTKTEAEKQPVADKAAADKLLVDTTAAKTAAEAAKKTSEEAAVAASNALDAHKPIKEKATQEAAAAEKAFKEATDKLAQAKDAAGKKPDDAALAEAVKVAEAAHKDFEAKLAAATKAKGDAEKTFADLETAKKTTTENKQKADKAFTDSQTAFTQAEQKVKQLAPIAQKAVDEKNTADRNAKAAQRSVVRAEESLKKATEAIGGFEAAVKQTEELAKQADMQSQAAQATVQQSEKAFTALALAADGQSFFLAGDDGLIHRRDAETGAPLETFSVAKEGITCLAVVPTGVVLFTKSNAGAVWSIPMEWKLERTIGSPDDATQIIDRVTAIDFSPDGKFLATGSGEPSRSGEVKIWSLENGQPVRALAEPHSDTVFGLEFSPDGKHIATCAADRFMKVFKVEDGSFVRAFEGHTHHVTGVSWRADGRLLASCGADAVVKIWDANSGDQQRTIQGLNKEVTSLHFVAESDNILVAGGANIVRLMNAANGGNVRDFPGIADYMVSAAASFDGKVIAAGGQDSVFRLWDANGQPWATFAPPAPQSVSNTAGK
jgi:WD40 repeat protein